uniref:Uncharacterized protein n=1 Tax=Octopus bimaculoides TaxID=37653 RepID=A0A0L8I2K0_OCTBM
MNRYFRNSNSKTYRCVNVTWLDISRYCKVAHS